MRIIPPISFRWKLLLAMMLVVGGVAGVTLYLTQGRVAATYQKLFEDQFKSQVTYFNEKQQFRLSTLMERCSDLCRSVRVIAAMDAGDAEIIYDTVWDEMDSMARNARRQVVSEQAAHMKKRGPMGNRIAELAPGGAKMMRLAPTNMVVIRVVDSEGKLLPDPKRAMLRRDRDAGQKMGWFIGHSVRELDHQDVGYMAVEPGPGPGPGGPGGGRTALREVVVTPIVDGGRTLGALIVGFPLPDMGEQQLSDMSRIRTGILLEGELHSKTIPENILEPLAAKVTEEMKVSATPRADFIFKIGSEPYRVFYSALNEDSPFPAAYQVGLYSLAAAELEKIELRWKILSACALVLLGALALSLLIAHGLSVPIRELVAGTEAIQKGEFGVKVPVRGRDEIGRLAASFNEMAEGLALKERYRSVLDMVADKNVAQELVNGSVALGGEQREISVLFCDIRGFTALTQNMPPSEVIAMLNEHMTALTKVVYEHDGVVDKFVGDLIMAIFGAPKSYENDAHNAARCALRMIQERAKLNETSKHKILMGIGIASGQAVAGCMGSSDRLNYTVLGERVNLASRLCGVAGPMEVVIDQTTREQLGEMVEVESLPELKLKGFSDAVHAYKVTALRSLRSKVETTE